MKKISTKLGKFTRIFVRLLGVFKCTLTPHFEGLLKQQTKPDTINSVYFSIKVPLVADVGLATPDSSCSFESFW